MTTGHLIARLELSLNRDVNDNLLDNTRRKFVALVELSDFFVGLSANAVDAVTDISKVLRKLFFKIRFEREITDELERNCSENFFCDLSSLLEKFR